MAPQIVSYSNDGLIGVDVASKATREAGSDGASPEPHPSRSFALPAPGLAGKLPQQVNAYAVGGEPRPLFFMVLWMVLRSE
jgi:hypothetical protein